MARWQDEVRRAERTLALIRLFVARSPRRDAWEARTHAALLAMYRLYGVPQPAGRDE